MWSGRRRIVSRNFIQGSVTNTLANVNYQSGVVDVSALGAVNATVDLNALGELLRESGRPPAEAEHYYHLALEIQQRLVRERPDEYEYQKELALSHNNLGIIEMDTGRPAEAREDLDAAVGRLAELETKYPARADCRHELARALINRGVLRHKNDDLEKAQEDYGQAVERLQALDTLLQFVQ